MMLCLLALQAPGAAMPLGGGCAKVAAMEVCAGPGLRAAADPAGDGQAKACCDLLMQRPPAAPDAPDDKADLARLERTATGQPPNRAHWRPPRQLL